MAMKSQVVNLLLLLVVVGLELVSASGGGVPRGQEEDRISAPQVQPAVPFGQFSGYVTVKEKHGRTLFYWLTETCTSPHTKPLVVWLNGEMTVADEVPSPRMVGNAFVEHYYSILHQQPHLVYRFYHETSVLSRPEEDGNMSLVTTINGINKKILSLDYTSSTVVILSVDVQPSYKDGVMVVVTGCLTREDDLKRKFTQSFFLAPQDRGYFVLNDVFRYLDDHKSVDSHSSPENDADESTATATFTPGAEPTHVPENIPPGQAAIVDDGINAKKEVNQQLGKGESSATEKVVDSNAVKESSQQESHPVIEQTASNTQEDTRKSSFASVVNAVKENAAPLIEIVLLLLDGWSRSRAICSSNNDRVKYSSGRGGHRGRGNSGRGRGFQNGGRAARQN